MGKEKKINKKAEQVKKKEEKIRKLTTALKKKREEMEAREEQMRKTEQIMYRELVLHHSNSGDGMDEVVDGDDCGDSKFWAVVASVVGVLVVGVW
eukprot:CAMPEP_0174273978 /NCGR_PEP_ID=MMETSP0439-20130205/56488_1 /TAXON_ID=0 /ORGANISM="Stereomyxa ramosa, Strain Chinc5" /LENGTH=94 /DNA_ID=CAMNT_0015365499 /DNA_START=195 /DNA_END=476 /DNA_ORIENTATION=-